MHSSKRFAVMGDPIAHSLSPQIHEAFAQQFNMALIYEKQLVTEDAFSELARNFFHEGGIGLNITRPHKQSAYQLADVLTERAKLAGAVNTLWQAGDKIYGDNTDGEGLVRDLNTIGSISEKRILILGAGGAVMGILGPLHDAGATLISVHNRTTSKVERLKDNFPYIQSVSDLSQESAYDLIIAATSQGLGEASVSLPKNVWHNYTMIYDLAYNIYKDTSWLEFAKAKGLKAFDGLGMLIEQAALAFNIWHQKKPDTSVLKATRLSTKGKI